MANYRGLAAQAAQRYGINPRIFLAQINQESGFNPSARSPAGALGIAQFMPGTARGMGVNPLDPVSSLMGAARLDAQYLKAYGGDWQKTLAAYNAGPGNVGRWQSIPETLNYVHNILRSAGSTSAQAVPAQQGSGATGAVTGRVVSLPALPGAGRFKLDPALAARLGTLSDIGGALFPRHAVIPGTPAQAAPSGGGHLLGAPGKIIGTPYQGTHAVAFNRAGGSDNWQSENAIDIGVPVGTPVYAFEAGTIDPNAYGPQGGGRFAGLRLNLLGADPAFYGHLSRLAVRPGQRVTPGTLLGYSGSASGVNHLHFAVQNGNPLQFYK